MKKIVSVLLLLAVVLGISACSMAKISIVGTWSHTTSVLGIETESTYTFNEDGTGKISGVLDVDFTYAFSGEELFITTNTLGIELTEKYTYEFKEDTLNLTSGNMSISLVKVPEPVAA